jgi:acetyl-CoA C-acetyltransferase
MMPTNRKSKAKPEQDAVLVAGIGQTPVGEHWDTSLRDLGVQAMRAAIQDAGGMRPQVLYAANTLAPNLSGQAHLAALLADHAGLVGIEASTLEAGGASGAAALRQAVLAIESGLAEAVLVVGVEKYTDSNGMATPTAAATTTDSEYEAVHGVTPAAQAALLARRYLHEYNLPPDGLAGFALTSHRHAAGNPNAMYRKPISLETYRQAEMVCEPLNLYDIAPEADGAAAVLLARASLLPSDHPHARVRIAASASAGDALGLHDRPDPLFFEAVRASTEAALEKAGRRREEMDLFEYYDAFSIFASLVLEAAGYAARGAGWMLARDEAIALTGQIPCATMGGSKGRGSPLGAVGVYQAVEAVLQLRGKAGRNQVEGAQVAMIQALAGPAALAVTHILERI